MKIRLALSSSLACAFLTLFHPVATHATWLPGGNPICTASGKQLGPRLVSDEAGGAIITWWDFRGGSTSDLYAQRIDKWGVVQWTTGGLPYCMAMNNQNDEVLIPDGSGDVIVAWDDVRNDPSDVYAQRINSAGAPQWTTDGVALCTASNYQVAPAIVSDGSGGAIVAWHDLRNGSTSDIYAQRVDAAGVVQWTTDGVGVCAAGDDQRSPVMIADGSGGAIIAWVDHRNGLDNDIYAQRIDGSGVAQWTTNGVGVCTVTNDQDTPKIVSDGAGGAIVTWHDSRGSTIDIFAQRLNASGAAQWLSNGVTVCTATAEQKSPVLVSDGAGGAVIAWEDYRAGYSDGDIYAQRIDPTGLPLWTADGVALCTAVWNQTTPLIASDGAGGAIVTWTDGRESDNNVYAQRVSAAGVVQWTSDGVELESISYDQYPTDILGDGAGGAMVTFVDYAGGNQDVYVQRVDPDGTILTAVGVTPSASEVVLSENYPNPFSAGTAFDLTLRREEPVNVEVFDAAGRRVRAIDEGHMGAGSNRLSFDGRDDRARSLPSGVYFYRVHAGNQTVTHKMVIER